MFSRFNRAFAVLLSPLAGYILRSCCCTSCRTVTFAILHAHLFMEQVDDAMEGDLADLQLALALGPKEAAAVREEVVSAAYRSAAVLHSGTDCEDLLACGRRGHPPNAAQAQMRLSGITPGCHRMAERSAQTAR